MIALPPGTLSLLVFFKLFGSMLGDVCKRLLFLFELLMGIFFLRRFSLTRLTFPRLEEVSDCGFPMLLAPTDCDLLLAESTLLGPFPLPAECSLLEISLIFVFFLA